MGFAPGENCFRRREIVWFVDIEKRIKWHEWPIDGGAAIIVQKILCLAHVLFRNGVSAATLIANSTSGRCAAIRSSPARMPASGPLKPCTSSAMIIEHREAVPDRRWRSTPGLRIVASPPRSRERAEKFRRVRAAPCRHRPSAAKARRRGRCQNTCRVASKSGSSRFGRSGPAPWQGTSLAFRCAPGRTAPLSAIVFASGKAASATSHRTLNTVQPEEVGCAVKRAFAVKDQADKRTST